VDIGVEISLYPLDADFVPPIREFIAALNADGRVKVVTSSMSTEVFGKYEDVFDILARELRGTFERERKSVFVLKVVGPLGPT
jgi:uncharacterized protein YqgV (UPF0045/DUF77 family)